MVDISLERETRGKLLACCNYAVQLEDFFVYYYDNDCSD